MIHVFYINLNLDISNTYVHVPFIFLTSSNTVYLNVFLVSLSKRYNMYVRGLIVLEHVFKMFLAFREARST